MLERVGAREMPRVSQPPSRLYLDAGPAEPYHCAAIDVTTTVTVESGAEVRLEADVYGARQIRNRDPEGEPIVVPGVPPAPDAYDGQLIQMDVVGIERER